MEDAQRVEDRNWTKWTLATSKMGSMVVMGDGLELWTPG